MFAVGDVEVVGAVDGKAGGLIQTLGWASEWVGGGGAGIAFAGDGESDQGAHRAGGIDLADAVILRVRDVLISVRVEDDVGGAC